MAGEGAERGFRLLLAAFERSLYRASLLDSDPKIESQVVVRGDRFETTAGPFSEATAVS